MLTVGSHLVDIAPRHSDVPCSRQFEQLGLWAAHRGVLVLGVQEQGRAISCKNDVVRVDLGRGSPDAMRVVDGSDRHVLDQAQ